MNNKINIIDFKAKEAIYQVILPLNLAINIPAGDSVRLLSILIDELDFENAFIDCTKFEANANKYSFCNVFIKIMKV